MTKIRVRSVKRKEVDEERLALAFLLLAKILHERELADDERDDQEDASEGAA